jgi:competence protein ComEC
MPFGAERPFLAAMGWSIDRMLELATVVALWSEHLRASPLLSSWGLVLALVALAWFCFFNTRWRLLGPLLLVPLVPLVALDRAPDVLIADTTQATVIRGPAGLELADGKPASFALDVWRETYAEPIEAAAATSCDSIACIGQSSAGFTYAIVEDYAAFGEECGRADLIIARMNAPAFCRAAAVIDAGDLRAGGVQWLRWDAADKSFEQRSAIPPLVRPWRIGATP